MRKIRNRKLNHLFINIPLTIPQMLDQVNIQFGNKAGRFLFRIQGVHSQQFRNATNASTNMVTSSSSTKAHGRCPGRWRQI